MLVDYNQTVKLQPHTLDLIYFFIPLLSGAEYYQYTSATTKI